MLQASANVEDKASGEIPQAGGQGDKPDEKGHWKLRALANIRRHSDTDIFVNSAQRRSPPLLNVVERLDLHSAAKGILVEPVVRCKLEDLRRNTPYTLQISS